MYERRAYFAPTPKTFPQLYHVFRIRFAFYIPNFLFTPFPCCSLPFPPYCSPFSSSFLYITITSPLSTLLSFYIYISSLYLLPHPFPVFSHLISTHLPFISLTWPSSIFFSLEFSGPLTPPHYSLFLIFIQRSFSHPFPQNLKYTLFLSNSSHFPPHPPSCPLSFHALFLPSLHSPSTLCLSPSMQCYSLLLLPPASSCATQEIQTIKTSCLPSTSTN